VSERGCGECAARCGGRNAGNCADGLNILRAVLAAGLREAVAEDGHSLGGRVGSNLNTVHATNRISAEHALTVLQTLHAAGVDVLARGPADETMVLHAAAHEDAAVLVRWLIAEAGASVDERTSDVDTPLLLALARNAWSAAHALLDCGARVDVQSTTAAGAWPVLFAAAHCDTGCALLLRILAADGESLLRCTSTGITALHVAATCNTDALKLLLCSGLPHVTEAINAIAVQLPSPELPGTFSGAPLHCACTRANWDSALALLAAGARVDIPGYIDSKLQTVAEWGRSPDCKHRGVKSAIAARAREHAAQAAATTKGLLAGGARCVAAQAPAAASATVETAEGDSVGAAVGVVAHGVAGASAAATAANPGVRALPPKGRKGRRGAASNRAEEASAGEIATTEPPARLDTPATAIAAGSPPLAPDGSVGVPASTVALENTAFATLNSCDNPAAAVAPAILGGLVASHAGASSQSPLNLPEDPLSQATLAAGFSSDAARSPAHHSPAASCAEGSGSVCAPPESTDLASADGPCAASTNICEPGSGSEAGSNSCEPGEAPEPNACEQGEGATSLAAAAAAIPAHSNAAEGDTAADSVGAALIAALQDGGVSAAAVRRHLAALSELARDPAAAAALESQGAVAAVTAALSRHGAAVSRAAGALLTVIGAAGGEEGDSEA